MKRLINATTSNRQTLREYLETNIDKLGNMKITVVDLTPYPDAIANDDGYIDCPGILCDVCTADEILNSPTESDVNYITDNYLLQDDLDRCIIDKIEPSHNPKFGDSLMILVKGF